VHVIARRAQQKENIDMEGTRGPSWRVRLKCCLLLKEKATIPLLSDLFSSSILSIFAVQFAKVFNMPPDIRMRDPSSDLDDDSSDASKDLVPATLNHFRLRIHGGSQSYESKWINCAMWNTASQVMFQL